MKQFDIGSKFGDWTVLGPGKKYYYWLCQCICGREVEVWGSNIGRRSTGCGCRIREKVRAKFRESARIAYGPYGGSLSMALFARYKSGAKYRGIDFDLSLPELAAIVSQPCHYCGAHPFASVRGVKGFYTGIDRKDRKQGYTVDNVVPCCWPCNRFKGTLSYSEFTSRAKLIAAHLNRPIEPPADTQPPARSLGSQPHF